MLPPRLRREVEKHPIQTKTADNYLTFIGELVNRGILHELDAKLHYYLLKRGTRDKRKHLKLKNRILSIAHRPLNDGIYFTRLSDFEDVLREEFWKTRDIIVKSLLKERYRGEKISQEKALEELLNTYEKAFKIVIEGRRPEEVIPRLRRAV